MSSILFKDHEISAKNKWLYKIIYYYSVTIIRNVASYCLPLVTLIQNDLEVESCFCHLLYRTFQINNVERIHITSVE